MGYDFSWHKPIDTSDEKTRKDFWITILRTIATEEDMFWGTEYELYEFEMKWETYIEYIKSVVTWYWNFRDETMDYCKKSEFKDIVTTFRSIDQWDCCNKCKAFDWTITKSWEDHDKECVKCEECWFEETPEKFFMPYEKYEAYLKKWKK